MKGRLPLVGAAVLALVLVGALIATAGHEGSSRFPSADPDLRVGTPDDPNFDCAEPDDEDDGKLCSTVWEEQYNLFGFPPASTRFTAVYRDIARLGQGQVSGVSADRAWKTTIGQPEVAIAIIDTGIRWERSELRTKIWLNRGELPLPQLADGTTAATHDTDGDGAFTVDDYAEDARVSKSAGRDGIPGLLDGQDLIVAFSDGVDDDANGYIDDIAGWDFFDDDNDPFDASSYSSANNHGSGRAEEAARQTDDGRGDAGVCPKCRVMMLRLWDTFVAPADNYAMATIYAADNGAQVQEVALGMLQNSRFAQAATQYAFHKGVALMQVSSDLNTANHNYPTNYNNTIFVAGAVADTHGLGEDDQRLGALLRRFGIPAGSQLPVGTWFRNSNLTQFGGHAHIVMVATTGSQATGQAAGAAGLLMSRGLEVADAIGGPLTSNEVKQLLTLTAEDVLEENTIGTGVPDHAQPGWDQHFGYGRVNLGAAVARVSPGKIPPEAGIESPPWFAPLDPVRTPKLPVAGFANASRAASFTFELAYAPGVEPLESQFRVFATGAGSDKKSGGLGTLPLDEVSNLLPGSAEGVRPGDPHQYAFTVRLRVRDDLGNLGEDRKTLFAFHDPTVHTGWPKFVDTGGDQSLRIADLDGDGALDLIAANTSGEIAVYNHDGSPASFFNNGLPFRATIPSFVSNHLGAPAFARGDVEPGRGGFTTPAIGDLDRDGFPEIVAANGDRVWALRADGSVMPGFPVAIDPTLSAPAFRTKQNHLKTGIFSSPALGDLDGDGRLDIVVAAMDQHAYAWNAGGQILSGWPVRLTSGPLGAESINTPALADLDGHGILEVIVASNEVYGAVPPGGIEDALRRGLINLAAGAVGVSSPLYAIHHDGGDHPGGPFVAGWPVSLNGLTDLLPLVGPGVDAVVADADPTAPGLEVINGGFSGDWVVIGGNGRVRYALQGAASAGANPSPGTIINTAEHAAIGRPVPGGSLAVFKGGLPLAAAVNLLLVGQNLPFTHVLQGWDAASGMPLPGWPQAIDDFQILTGPAIADVGGDKGREVIQGSGLYLLHAFGGSGVEPSDFPKFTGGWISGTTTVADLDGDGKLELANWTREGHLFVWDTDAPACGGNDEWWGFRHDEHNSGNYGTDTRPPSTVTDLAVKTVSPGAGREGQSGGIKGNGQGPKHKLELSWTAPGGDHSCGRAASYELRSSNRSIRTPTDWGSAEPVPVSITPAPSGSAEKIIVEGFSPSRYFALRSTDHASNIAPLSNSARAVGGGPADSLTVEPDHEDESTASSKQRSAPAAQGLPATGWLLIPILLAAANYQRKRAATPS